MDLQEKYFFSFLQGGVVCHRCEDKLARDGPLDQRSYNYLKAHCETVVETSLHSGIEKFFHTYFLFHYGKPFRSFNYLRAMKQFS